MIQLFPLSDDAPHIILIFMLFLTFVFLSHKHHDSKLQIEEQRREGQGKKAGKDSLKKGQKGCFLIASVKE